MATGLEAKLSENDQAVLNAIASGISSKEEILKQIK